MRRLQNSRGELNGANALFAKIAFDRLDEANVVDDLSLPIFVERRCLQALFQPRLEPLERGQREGRDVGGQIFVGLSSERIVALKAFRSIEPTPRNSPWRLNSINRPIRNTSHAESIRANGPLQRP